MNPHVEEDVMKAKEEVRRPASFPLRLPTELQEWVREKAAKDDRSQNYVLVKLVEEAKGRERAA